MGSLSNLYISQSYISLIHLGSNNTASVTPTELQDGLGNGVGVSVSTNKNLYVSGNVYATNLTGSTINTGSLVTTSSFNSYTASQDFKNTTFATTGSNTFVGNQIISGTFFQSGSNTLGGGPTGQKAGTYIKNRVIIGGTNGTDGPTPRLFISGSDGVVNTIGRNFISINSTPNAGFGAIYNQYGDDTSAVSFTQGIFNPNDNSNRIELQINTDINGTQFSDHDQTIGDYSNWLTIAPNNGVTIPTPQLVRGLGVTGSAIFTELTGSLGAFSASVNSRLNSGGSAVGAITTGSNGQEQSITGSLGLTTLNNVSAINTLFTASTAPTPMEGTSSAVYFVSYSSVPDGYPNAFNVDASGNWTVSGSGVNNQIITSVDSNDNGLLYQAGGATFTQGQNYVFKAATFYNTLNVNGGLIQLQTDSIGNAVVQAGNNTGDQNYPGFRTVVNSTTNPGDIFSFIAMDDAGSGASFGLKYSTYTSLGSGLVGAIYGGGGYNRTQDAIYFVSSSIRMLKPTTFNAPVTFNSSASFTELTGSLGAFSASVNSRLNSGSGTGAITASAFLATSQNGGAPGAFAIRAQSSGSIPNTWNTSLGKDFLDIYQYQGQPYAFNMHLSSDQLRIYSGSQFLFGLQTNGSNQSQFGGSTYYALASGSYTSSVGAGSLIPGLNIVGNNNGGFEINDFKAPSVFEKNVYIDQGLYVSQSSGGRPAITINSNGGAGLLVTGSIEIINGSLKVSSINTNVAITGSLSIVNGYQLKLPSGSNQQTGLATLNGGNPGTATISNSLVNSNSIIMLTKQTLNNSYMVAVSSKGSNTFTITSNGNGDSDVVAYMIINPS